MIWLRTILFVVTVSFFSAIQAQTGISDSAKTISHKYLDQLSEQSGQIEKKLEGKSLKALEKLRKQEERISRKLSKKDAEKAKSLISNTEQRYKSIEDKLKNKTSSLKQYIPSLDTISTSLQFLQQNPELLSKVKDAKQKLDEALSKVKGLEQSFQKAEDVKQFLRERKQYLKQQLQQLAFAKELKKLNKQVYYYNEQINEYKALLKDHKKTERKALELLSKTKLFKDFMRKNSQLALLFRLPGDPNDPVSQANLRGLQTRVQVNNLIQQQIAVGGPNAQAQFRQKMQEAQNQINQLKNKMNKFGRGSRDDELPEGFKPNNQKTKSFWQRLECGTNIQSQKPNGYFPVTSDIGLSLGYKLNDKSIIGVGASYKLGWGQNIRHINITSQGAGIRSFVDWKIKGSFWVSGGYEMNYQTEFNRIDELKELNAWQQSGLVGLSKVVSMKTKFFKKTKLQLLWDFLSYHQVPRTQPVVFRVGYTF